MGYGEYDKVVFVLYLVLAGGRVLWSVSKMLLRDF